MITRLHNIQNLFIFFDQLNYIHYISTLIICYTLKLTFTQLETWSGGNEACVSSNSTQKNQ